MIKYLLYILHICILSCKLSLENLKRNWERRTGKSTGRKIEKWKYGRRGRIGVKRDWLTEDWDHKRKREKGRKEINWGREEDLRQRRIRRRKGNAWQNDVGKEKETKRTKINEKGKEENSDLEWGREPHISTRGQQQSAQDQHFRQPTKK